ncbi:MAG: class I SAM-dependent methyltransferase [Candidatus Aminicenantes bacterium]|nr:class I SAM-dependent methyltransferase [Candidatus Aminicenantes bacterium]
MERELWHELRERILQGIRAYSGNDDPDRISHITNNWFNDRDNYDGRWSVIRERLPGKERILDIAAGCGTFLLHGLHLGRDVWGVEPESWKQQYFSKKIAASGYPATYRPRLVPGWGEALPFPDAHFGLVTTFQTLEHVRDVRQCLSEMLRVLKPGGVLYVRAPDYSGFFEPHYGIFFWPKMNKNIAALYLKFLGRPLTALHELNWITERQIISLVRELPYATSISRTSATPEPTRHMFAACQSLRHWLARPGRFLQEEKQIDLWVTKIA